MSAIPGLASAPGFEGTRLAPQAGRRHTLAILIKDPVFVLGVAVLIFWVVMAVAWRRFAPFDPFALGSPIQSPSREHLMGTDELGRDVLSRVLAGASPIFTVAPAASALSLMLGTIVGLAAGFYRGIVDDVLMRIADVLLAFPVIVIAAVVLALLGTSTVNLIIVIALIFLPNVARTVRSVALAEREQGYVDASRIRGESGPYMMFVDMLPNAVGVVLVEGTLRLGWAVFTAATLAFLGLGVQPPSPDWGLTIAQERALMEVAWWTVAFPAAALASLVVSVTMVADSLKRVYFA